MIKARSHSEWPSRELSSGTPDLNRLACSGIRGEGEAQHAIEHTKPHPGYVPCLRLLASGLHWIPWLLLCSGLRRMPTICSSLLRAFQCISCNRLSTAQWETTSLFRCSAGSLHMPPVLPKMSRCSWTSAYPAFSRRSNRVRCCS